jgi:hypothetical protein
MTDDRTHMLRIPQRIRDGLEPIARRNHRTFAEQARYVLDRYLITTQTKQQHATDISTTDRN